MESANLGQAILRPLVRAAWGTVRSAALMCLSLLGTAATVLLIPLGAAGILFTAIFGFATGTPGVHEHRWGLLFTSLTCFAAVSLLRLVASRHR